MSKFTPNYNFKKPEPQEYYSILDQNDNMDILDAALTPTADLAQVPTGQSGKLTQWVSWFANRIKAITGKTNWYDAPDITLANASSRLNAIEADIQVPDTITSEDTAAVITLPGTVKDGILQGTLKGRTVVNLVTNGDFRNGIIGWSNLNSSISANNNTLTIAGSGADLYVQPYYTSKVRLSSGVKVYVCATMRVTNSVCTSMGVVVNNGTSSFVNVANPTINNWYKFSQVLTLSGSGTVDTKVYLTHSYANAAVSTEKIMEAQQIEVINLTAMFGAGNEPNLAECEKLFPYYIDGMRSVDALRVKSVGRNLIRNGNGESGISFWNPYNTNTKLSLIANGLSLSTDTNHGWVRQSVVLKPNTYYRISIARISGDGRAAIYRRNADGSIAESFAILSSSLLATTFYTSRYTDFYFIMQKGTAGTCEFEKFMFTEGTTPTTYEPYTETEAYISDSLGSLPNGVCDTRNLDGSGIQNTKEYILQGTDISYIDTSWTNADRVITIAVVQDYLQGNAISDNMIISGFNQMSANAASDSLSNIGKFYIGSSGIIAFIIAKGTYANTAAAQAALIGTRIRYQLATPVTSKFAVVPLIARANGTITIESTVVPTFRYTLAENSAAQAQSVIEGTGRLGGAIDSAQNEINAHLADITSHGEIINTYRSGKDSNSIFTTIEYKRLDGTLAKKSVLSGGTSPKYTTRTVTYYAANGTTVLITKVYTLTYTGDDFISEVSA